MSSAPHPLLAGAPLLIAHRGGAGLYPENTLYAFSRAHELWQADMLELDVHATADGRCVVIHDPTVDRTTDGTGDVASMTLAELQSLDAAYHFSRDGGRTYPLRGRGVRIPTIDEVLEALPTMRITVEVKTGAAQRPLFDALEAAGARDRIILASAYDRDRTLFHEWKGALSASVEHGRRFYTLHRLHCARFGSLSAHVVQMPETWDGRRIVTPRFIRDVHRRGSHVHIWTVNETADMERLLDWGADGLVTDRPDRLARVLHARVGRPLPPGDPELGTLA
ncbi:MAG: glycerophosphodiester phosphodiesterase [Candidatus Cloacimonetes bacterium]|nr:glycerophosphodiester phosphodiesterase [Candidatus Cloacimonadota bacterium]